MSVCDEVRKQIPALFEEADEGLCMEAIKKEDFSLFPEIPNDIRLHIAQCSDCMCDLEWFLKIRDEIEISTFPCIHMAYAASSKANRVIAKGHGMFALKIKSPDSDSIVIGFCPWCGIELNTSATSN